MRSRIWGVFKINCRVVDLSHTCPWFSICLPHPSYTSTWFSIRLLALMLRCHLGGGVRYLSNNSPMYSNYVASTDAFLLLLPLSIHVKAKTKLNHYSIGYLFWACLNRSWYFFLSNSSSMMSEAWLCSIGCLFFGSLDIARLMLRGVC